MARKKSTTPTTPATPTTPIATPLVLPFEGKTFWLDSQIALGDRRGFTNRLQGLGGRLQDDVDENLTYLVVASKRTTTSQAEKKAAKVGGSITILRETDLHALLCPSRELALAILRGGPAEAKRWSQIQPDHRTSTRIDLAGADLSGLDLSEFQFVFPLEGVRLAGSKLDGTSLSGARNMNFQGVVLSPGAFLGLGTAEDCNFDSFPGSLSFLGPLTRCSFRNARLAGSMGNYLTCTACDFTGADLSGIQLSSWKTTDFKAPGANFSNARLKTTFLTGADLTGANFEGANLTECRLEKADLRKANFRNANLADADLSNAQVAGADFTGANLRGTKLDGVDLASAKGLGSGLKEVKTAGPILHRLIQDGMAAKRFEMEFTLVSPTQGYCQVSLYRAYSTIRLSCSDSRGNTYTTPPSAEGALLDLRLAWPDGVPQVDSIKAKVTPTDKTFQGRAVQALCELFDQPIPDTKDLATARKSAKSSQRETLLAELRLDGAADAWNKRPDIERKTLSNFDAADLSGTKLAGINFALISAAGANFSGADLRNANLLRTDLTGANFQNVDLEGANLRHADLSGADLSGANLKDVQVLETRYDEDTKLPAGFVHSEGWRYVGSAPPPAALTASAPVKETLDFPAFFGKLSSVADAGRIKNAVSMLKAEKFQLFAETADDKVIGVVRSQSSKDRVYACRLTSAGQFECGTQNLRPCGGLQGKVCKHLLVLILGLTKGGAFDSGSAFQWLQLTQRQGPTFDKEVMTATFLRYKGVETGTVDWRPTETVPEDYYAL
jgi:uncharacterized protein YjbI with pentapeptide repeats